MSVSKRSFQEANGQPPLLLTLDRKPAEIFIQRREFLKKVAHLIFQCRIKYLRPRGRKHPANIDYVPFAPWDDLPSLEHDMRDDDCLWFVMSRRERVSYHPARGRIPTYLEHNFAAYSSVLLYPVQAGDTESRYI